MHLCLVGDRAVWAPLCFRDILPHLNVITFVEHWQSLQEGQVTSLRECRLKELCHSPKVSNLLNKKISIKKKNQQETRQLTGTVLGKSQASLWKC